MANFDGGSVIVKMLMDVGPFTRGLGRVREANRRAMQSLERSAASARSASLAFAAVGAAASGAATQIIRVAAEAEETQNLFRISMGRMAEDSIRWSEAYSESLGGLNTFEIQKQLGVFNQMIKNLGLSEDAAYDMSKAMTRLTFDMASFFNISEEAAFLKIQSGLSGELEPLKRIGIVVSQELMRQKALQLGMIRTINEHMTEGEKIYARYRIVLDQTAHISGDLYRTQNSLANSWRILTSVLKRLFIEMGNAAKEDFRKLLVMVKNIAQDSLTWVKANQDLVRELILVTSAVGAVALVVAPILLLLPGIAIAVNAITTSVLGLATALTLLTAPITLTVGLLAAGGLAIAHLVQMYRSNYAGLKTFVDGVVADIKAVFGKVKDFLNGIAIALAGFIEFYKVASRELMKGVHAWPGAFEKAGESANRVLDSLRGRDLIGEFVGGKVSSLFDRDAIAAEFEKIKTFLDITVVQFFRDTGSNLKESLLATFGFTQTEISNAMGDAIDWIDARTEGSATKFISSFKERASAIEDLTDIIKANIEEMKSGIDRASQMPPDPIAAPDFFGQEFADAEDRMQAFRAIGVDTAETIQFELDLINKRLDQAKRLGVINSVLTETKSGVNSVVQSYKEWSYAADHPSLDPTVAQQKWSSMFRNIDASISDVIYTAKEASRTFQDLDPGDIIAVEQLKIKKAELEAAQKGFTQAGIETRRVIELNIERLQRLYDVAESEGQVFEMNEISRALEDLNDKLKNNGYREFEDAGITTTAMLREQRAELERMFYLAEAQGDLVAADNIERMIYDIDSQATTRFSSVGEQISAGFRDGFRQVAMEWSDLRGQLSSGITSIANSFATGMTSGIMDFIKGTKSAKEAFSEFAAMIIEKIIATGIQMAIQYGMAQVMMAVIGTQAVTLGSAIAAAYTAPAALVSLATLGTNSAPAIAGIASTFAATSAMSAGAGIVGTGGGFNRGIEEVPFSGFYKLHAGEQVVPKYEKTNRAESQPMEVVIINTLNPTDLIKAGVSNREGENVIVNVIDSNSLRSGKTRQIIQRR